MSELSAVEIETRDCVDRALTRCLRSDLRRHLLESLLAEEGDQWKSVLVIESAIRDDALQACLELKQKYPGYSWVDSYSLALDRAVHFVRGSFEEIQPDAWVEQRLDEAMTNPAPWLTMLLTV